MISARKYNLCSLSGNDLQDKNPDSKCHFLAVLFFFYCTLINDNHK